MQLIDFGYIIVATILILLPGGAILAWLGRGIELTICERVGLTASIAIALYPPLHLWAYQFGLQIGQQLVWVCSIVGLLALIGHYFFGRSGLQERNRLVYALPQIFTVGIIILLCFSRLYAIRDMVAPAWGDSVQHTILAQLFVDHNGLFQSWLPYAQFETFTYHFGFHLAAANGAWISGLALPDAVLGMGQMLNVLAVLALYPVAVRFCKGNQWAGLGAIIIGGFLSLQPAFYLNWGRYTQLTGQVILPGLIWAFDRWWNEEECPTFSHAILIIILAAGMALTHYRVALLSMAAAMGWTLWGLWRWRHNLQEWRIRLFRLVALATVAGLLIAPWLQIVAQGKLPSVYGGMIQRTIQAPATYSELGVWRSLDTFYPLWLWGSGLVALLLGTWRTARHFVPLLLWGGIVFIMTNPFLLQLPGTGWISNFLVVLALYIPLSIGGGWLIGQLSQLLQPNQQWLIATLLLLGALWGLYRQEQVVDPFFQMVMSEDEAAFAWIDEHVSMEASFAVNGFLAFGDRTVVGSDAGWWLPYYTQRANTIPPLISIMESTQGGAANGLFRQLHVDVQQTGGDAVQLRDTFCRYAITHVYLGQKRGTVGFGAIASFPEQWLVENQYFKLLHQVGQAQVWQFHDEHCL